MSRFSRVRREAQFSAGRHSSRGFWDPLQALLETWCDHELQWVLYETNAPPLWTQLGRHVRGYLATLWLTGALRGGKPGEAFFVTCDQSTMTAEDIGAGHLICVVGLASVKLAEFVLYRIKIRLKTPAPSHRADMVSLLA